MKFTVAFIGLLSISMSWASMDNKSEDQKDKREAPVGYPSAGHSSQTLQIPSSLGHDDSNTISIGAGYSVGGAKAALGYGGHIPSSGLQYGGLPQGLASGGHATVQLPPITLQPSHGSFASGDISQIMSQLSHGLQTGSIQLQPISGGSYHSGALGGHEGSQAQYTFNAPKYQQYQSVAEHSQPAVPSYAIGTKGLGSYGSTGPVLFNPSDSHNTQQLFSYNPSAGHSFGESGVSLGNSGHSLGNSGHSFGNSGHSLGNSGHSLGNSGHSLGNSGHSFSSVPFKTFGGGYGGSGKSSFKPSAFLGASVQTDSGHGLSSLSTHAIPSYGQAFAHGPISLASSGHGGFGASLGGGFGGSSSKLASPSYLPAKSESFGGSFESAAAFSGNNHFSSPPGTTYGIPSSSYGLQSSSAHAASSSPQYYISKHAPSHSFGEGSSSYKAPISSHSMLSSFAPGPKYSFGGNSGFSGKYASPKDNQGAYSESTYNTIKYSEELKPRSH